MLDSKIKKQALEELGMSYKKTETAENENPEDQPQDDSAKKSPDFSQNSSEQNQNNKEPEKDLEPTSDDPDESDKQRIMEKSQLFENQLMQVQNSIADMQSNTEEQLSRIIDAITRLEAQVAGFGQNHVQDDELHHFASDIQEIKIKLDRNDRQLIQTLRQNADFQIQVRQGMQKDLDKLRDEQAGEQFTPILTAIADVYSDYRFILADEMPEQLRHNLNMMFDQLRDILEDNDAEICECNEGDERPSRQCRVIEKILTGDKAKNNTVAKSRKPGVVRGRKVLKQEFVDLYIYDESLDVQTQKTELPAQDPNAEPNLQIETIQKGENDAETEPEASKNE